ncbi:DUF4468 domain-containing protein [Chryseobacterium indologenes]|uniref:DUF4468 domain-containing protein n=1 Tax=Chryseobacterium indologenes TaxID=253 RepID=A0A0N0ZVL0_CHRID|nr:DUF4468 domain-containing protein [Chryseobacterium indologenes]KPE50117.1 hypothetical protein AOB46_16900 [Chryseobacterium indologenes]
MRKLLLMFCVLVTTVFYAQENSLEYKLIDSLKAKKELLYSGAKSWISNAFNSSKAIIDMEDKESGRIIGKAYLNPSKQHRCMMYDEISNVSFKFVIDVKENKYRIVLSDFYHTGKYANAGNLDPMIPPNGFGNGCGKKNAQRVYDEIKSDVKNQSELILRDFKNTINKSIKNDDF